jgi:2-iminobutanoate/2-iminopropanoate deaminase
MAARSDLGEHRQQLRWTWAAMSRRRVIELDNVQHSAPIPTAVLIDNVLVSSAIFGADPETGAMPERVEDEVTYLFANIRTVLKAADATTDDVLRMGVLLRDTEDRKLINEHWLSMFPDANDRPARHITVVSNLPARVQIEFMAVLAPHPEGDHES